MGAIVLLTAEIISRVMNQLSNLGPVDRLASGHGHITGQAGMTANPFLDEHRPGWHAQAACAGIDTETFFPSGSTGTALNQIERAKAVCAICPVCSQCLDYALDTGQTDGVWGGLDPDQRRAEHRRRSRRRRD
jgi:WhiB family transcriptional regulator, redox-sensing transcriptional regulator